MSERSPIPYNTQQLLFNQQPYVIDYRNKGMSPSEQFHTEGFMIIDNIEDANEALRATEQTLAGIDIQKMPLQARLLDRLQLAKADRIPICSGVVDSDYQILHFDMGQPITSDEPQTMYLYTALYAPTDAPAGNAQTRLLSLKGLFADSRWGGRDVLERNLIDYALQYGDGWLNQATQQFVNTQRLAHFPRILDAINGTKEFAHERDKVTGKWFDPNLNASAAFAAEHDLYFPTGVNLEAQERRVQLKPGEVLIFDNTKVVHGRIGRRRPQEVYQFMFGAEQATPEDIDAFREDLVNFSTTN